MSKRELLTMAEAALLFPPHPCEGGKRHIKPRTVQRRITEGDKGVKLRGVRDGRRWFTTKEWIEQYQRDLTAAALEGELHPADRATHQANTEDELQRRFGIVCGGAQ